MAKRRKATDNSSQSSEQAVTRPEEADEFEGDLNPEPDDDQFEDEEFFQEDQEDYRETPREYEGVVVRVDRVWRKTGKGTTKYWNTKIKYDTETGIREGQLLTPTHRYLAPGTEVLVQRTRRGALRVTPLPEPEDERPAGSWKRPDIKSGAILIAVIMVVALIGLIILFVYIKSTLNGIPGIIKDLPTNPPTPTGPAPSGSP